MLFSFHLIYHYHFYNDTINNYCLVKINFIWYNNCFGFVFYYYSKTIIESEIKIDNYVFKFLV